MWQAIGVLAHGETGSRLLCRAESVDEHLANRLLPGEGRVALRGHDRAAGAETWLQRFGGSCRRSGLKTSFTARRARPSSERIEVVSALLAPSRARTRSRPEASRVSCGDSDWVNTSPFVSASGPKMTSTCVFFFMVDFGRRFRFVGEVIVRLAALESTRMAVAMSK